MSIRHAWRSLRRTPVFTIAAGTTLVIGLGAAIAIFAVVNGVLLRPLPYGNADRLVGAWHDLPPLGLMHNQQTNHTFFTYRRLARTIEGIGVYQDGAVNVSEPGGAGEPQRLTSAWVSAEVIPVLQVPPLLGRVFLPEEDLPNGPYVVIISEAQWRNRFGADPKIIGRTLDVGGRSRQIIGVMPQRFRFPDAATQLWLPLQLDPNGPGEGFSLNSVARLKSGVSVADAQRDFAAVLPRMVELYPQFVKGVSQQMLMDQAKPRPVLVPMRDDVTGGIARTLWIVAAAAGLVLLVACANVTNLILVRADGRQRELAVREALGAGRARVMAHFFSESVLLTSIAGAVGFGVAALAVRALKAMGPAEIPRLAEVSIDWVVVLFAIVAVAVVAAVCSAIPALRIGRIHISNALREGGRGGTVGKTQQRVRGALVAAQIALALVVLAGSGLLMRTFQRLSSVRPGYDPTNVATFWVSLPQARYANDSAVVRFYAALSERIAQVPGVRTVGLTSRLPLRPYGMNQNPYYPENDPAYDNKIPPLQLFTTIGADYFKAMGIPLIAGRTFERMGVQRDGEAVISRETAKAFYNDSTGASALGKRFRPVPGMPWVTVIGVVGSVRDTALAAPPTRAVYLPQAVKLDETVGNAPRAMAIVARTAGDPAAITSAVQGALRELDPSLPTFDVRPMAAVMRASMAQLSFTILILGAAAAVTLLLGAIGLYGVMAYVVTLRTRELGVRLALGAAPRTVAAMMTLQGIAITAIGVVAGVGLFALVARFLRGFLYGVAPSDPVALGAAALMLVVVALLSSWIPARRAARVDPADALRAE
ncbi:MAG TPA: ABC transporter permease [Gemmatimonadaceae bacterium]|nr:ABC transporter permease [Gemmatimonadaceae bacterium]